MQHRRGTSASGLRPSWLAHQSRAGVGRVVPLLLSLLAWGLLPPLSAEPAPDVELRYHLVSAFLYNFLLFVDWPPDSVPPRSPYVIGVMGPNPFGSAVAAIERKTVQDHRITFRFFNGVQDLQPTHILYIPRQYTGEMDAIRRRLDNQPVLTVGEDEAFTRAGGVVRFFEVPAGAAERERALRVEINEVAAHAAGLKIRSKLMRLATVVRHPPPPVQP